MKKLEKQVLLRIDMNTYKMIKYLADKYYRSVNTEICFLLDACVNKWNVKNVKVHELPNVIKEIQDEDYDKEDYDNLVESIMTGKDYIPKTKKSAKSSTIFK